MSNSRNLKSVFIGTLIAVHLFLCFLGPVAIRVTDNYMQSRFVRLSLFYNMLLFVFPSWSYFSTTLPKIVVIDYTADGVQKTYYEQAKHGFFNIWSFDHMQLNRINNMEFSSTGGLNLKLFTKDFPTLIAKRICIYNRTDSNITINSIHVTKFPTKESESKTHQIITRYENTNINCKTI